MAFPKAYKKNFFKKWSHDMAYILGFMYADGNIVETKQGNHSIAIYTSDRPLLLDMCVCMGSDHKIAARKVLSGTGYRVQIGSNEWFQDLKKLGLIPNKTARMLLPHIPRRYFGAYVRGYFDGDGNVWTGLVHKDRKTPLQTIQVAFTSGSCEYLRAFHAALKSYGIAGGSMYASKTRNYCRLAFSVRDAFKLYEIMYNVPHRLYLERKKRVFERFARLRA